ncbi:MAG: nucleoid-structuring protein H-NS, partial [Candidatus Omnitrophica bacterium]|nr:nucleoid-structuring protein H-NS [Candidatus Omnitrophota bacterium]
MFREKIKVLDCTIRDGGLMNNHRFEPRFVREAYRAISEAGVDYMEIGYKNSKRLFSPKDYGKWKFCDEDDIKRAIDGIPSKTKLSIMVDVDRVDMDEVPHRKDSVISM